MVTSRIPTTPERDAVSTVAVTDSVSAIGGLAKRWGLPFHSLLYFGAIGVTCVLIFGQNVYAAKSLGPALYGVWNIFAITYSYGLLAHMGALNGLAREFPRAHADGKLDESHRLVQTAFWINAVSTALFAALAFLVLGTAFRQTAQVTWHVLLLFVTFLLLQGWTNFLMFLFRAQDQFRLLSAFTVLLNAGVLVGAFLLIPRWSLTGFVFAWTVSYLFVSILFLGRVPAYSFALPGRKLAGTLLRVGTPIMLFTLTATINWTMDRLLIARFLGVAAVGYFAVAAFAVRLLNYVPEMVSQVMYPHWAAARLSRNGRQRDVSPEPFRLMFWALPLLGALAYYACFLIPIFLPSYGGTVFPSQVLCLAASLTGVGLFCGAYLGATGRERVALGAQVGIVILRGLIVGGALFLGGTLLRAAYASAISSAAFGIALLWITARQFRARGLFLLHGLLPWVACTTWLVIVEFLRRRASWGNPIDISSFMVAVLLFLAGTIAFLLVGQQSQAPLLHRFPGHSSHPAAHHESPTE